MGVKDLWNIVSPLCDRQPMFELQGKTVAIDLSCWVVDSQTVVDNAVQPKMYLRNLYFRTAFLLLQGIWPVFVLEGKAPTIKYNTIAKRNDVRNGFQQRTSHKGTRSQFNRILKECKEMLIFMGLACVQGHGEAEAMCAYLNEDGLVDGCISQDSDCFLYGAKVVYRNFCTSAQGNRGGSGGAVDKYTLEKIERLLNLGRNKMIALALLCGCDYNDGLNGVGKEAAMKLFKIVKDEDILERIKSWRTDSRLDQKETELQCSNLCTSCGHNGKVQKHAKSGCVDCGTAVRCNDSYKEKRALILNEIALRKKALLAEDFPSQELLDEFLIRKDPVPRKVDLQWRQPQISKLIDFMERHLSWEPQYAFEKVFPLVTRWQLLHLPNISLEDRLLIPDLFVPEAIKKIRNIRSVASYEIMWRIDHDVVEKLKKYMASYKERDDSTDDSLTELTSIEPQDIVLDCYPEIVEAFDNARSLKAKKRPTKKKAENVIIGKDSEKDKKGSRLPKKGGKKPIDIENNRRIDEFVSKNTALSLEESFEKMNITPKRSKMVEKQQENQNYSVNIKRGPQFDKVLQLEKINSKLNRTLDRMFNELSPDDFISDNEEQELNMSEIIDNICSVKKVFQFSSISVDETNSNVKSTENCNRMQTVINSEAESNKCETSIAICDQSNDEFADIKDSYIPLNQRLLTLKNRNEFPLHSTEINQRFTLGFDDLMNDTDP
ncbi:PREDICTED: flap endonuclease GEN-like [Dufourea novaeangliae]|uniref:Flap endonuclease GEN n=1 Tax=Dufourea novaeangliae TaxID=178035 RepID=A0A154PAE0_DUFNO|nr:PREDICTED: flap endonuclease GEN-like [Dufourea novaeangliae]KZC08906.1 Flap endonuclease GEN [Dufourea novaeangliae]